MLIDPFLSLLLSGTGSALEPASTPPFNSAGQGPHLALIASIHTLDEVLLSSLLLPAGPLAAAATLFNHFLHFYSLRALGPHYPSTVEMPDIGVTELHQRLGREDAAVYLVAIDD